MGPVLPPRRRRLGGLLLPLATAGALAGGLGYLVHVWPAPEPFVVPRDRHPVSLAPITSDAAYLTGVGGPCLALLDDYLRRPGWTLTLSSGVSGCLGDSPIEAITFDADGDASWTGGGLGPRPLHLTPTQISALHTAAAASCELLPGEEGAPAFRSHFIDVHWGGPDAPHVRVRNSSAYGPLAAVIDDAVLGYRSRRLAERASFRGTFVVPAYALLGVDRPMKVTVEGSGKLTIRAGRRTITAERMELAALVDAIDWLEQGGHDPYAMPLGLRRALDRATFDAGLQPD